MAVFRFTVEIIAPQERVWTVWMDIDQWPAWNPVVNRVTRLDPGPLTVGSRTKILQPKLMPAVWRVTELDEATGVFIWTTSRPGVTVTGTHLVDNIGYGCRVTLILTYSGLLGPFIALSLKQLNWEYLTKEATGLRQRCEWESSDSAGARNLPSTRL